MNQSRIRAEEGIREADERVCLRELPSLHLGRDSMQWSSGKSFQLNRTRKRGSFHRVSIKHLHRYLTEFEYRFNERRNAERFELTVAEMLKTKPMPMKLLTADAF